MAQETVHDDSAPQRRTSEIELLDCSEMVVATTHSAGALIVGNSRSDEDENQEKSTAHSIIREEIIAEIG